MTFSVRLDFVFFLLFASILFILFYDFFFSVFFGASVFVYVFYGCWKHCLFVIFSAYTWSVIVANKREGSLTWSWMLHDSCLFFEISIQFHLYSDLPKTFHFHIEFCVHLVTCLTRSSSLFFLVCFISLPASFPLYLCNKFQYWTRSQTRIKHKFSKILDYYFICMPYSLPSTC